ncbi:hypothetical protein GWL_38340 [Herbaspirillum sp. GW103]|nr:hypothetical protein GWL_38340 [Herbaspirillum sp. GW103]
MAVQETHGAPPRDWDASSTAAAGWDLGRRTAITRNSGRG